MRMADIAGSPSRLNIADFDHALRMLLNESFRVLESTNWGFAAPSIDSEFKLSMEIARPVDHATEARVATPQTLTLVFAAAAGAERVTLVRVVSSAHECTPYDMPVLPRYLKISKELLAGRAADFGAQRAARLAVVEEYVMGASSAQARYTDFWDPFYSRNEAGGLPGANGY